MTTRPHNAIFTVPIVIGAISLGGLVIGLLGGGIYDILAGVALAVPVAVIGWSLRRARRGDWDSRPR